MKNVRYGVLAAAPFSSINYKKQHIISYKIDETGTLSIAGLLSNRVDDDFLFKNPLYLVNNSLQAITILKTSIFLKSYSAIESFSLNANSYIASRPMADGEIKHFTIDKKIGSINYFNESLSEVFSIYKYIKLKKEQSRKQLCEARYGSKSIKIYLSIKHRNIVSFFGEPQVPNIISLYIKSNKGLSLDELLDISKIVDACLNICFNINTRSERMTITDYRGTEYSYYHKVKSGHKSLCPIRYPLKIGNEQLLGKILSYLLSVNDDNVLLPFVTHLDDEPLELVFIRTYIAFERLHGIEQKTRGKEKNQTFLTSDISRYKTIKTKYFGDKSPTDKELEEEIRGLRNHYSHNGYYIDDGLLDIKKLNKATRKYVVARRVPIDTAWIKNRTEYLQELFIYHIFNKANIDIENEFIHSAISVKNPR